MMKTIAIYIYENAEVLDFSGPFEVFSTAKRLANLDWNVILIAEKLEPVIARGGFKVIPDYRIDNPPPIDILLVAGGIHTAEVKNTKAIEWIAKTAKQADYIASVCTGAFLLAKAKLLDNLTVTTHWEDIADLANDYPTLNVIDNKRWVKNGNIYISAGISAGIDMSLELLSELTSPELAIKTARQMDYAWQR